MRSDRIHLDPIEARCIGVYCSDALHSKCARAQALIEPGSPLEDFSLDLAMGRAARKDKVTTCVAFRLPQTRTTTAQAPVVHGAIRGIA